MTDRHLAYTLLAAGVAVLALAHWPGRLDLDSLGTIAHVRAGHVADQLSPVLTWLWGLAYRLVPIGPGIVLVAQLSALVGGLYLVLRSVYRPLAAAALAVAMPLAPPAFGLVALVGRDMWFVASCLLAAGLAVGAARWEGRGRAAAVAGVVAAAAVAVAARQNGFTAVAPILVALAVSGTAVAAGRRKASGRPRRLAAIAAGTAAAFTLLGASVVVGGAVRDRAWHPEVYTYLYDLGHLTLELERRLIPALPRRVQPVQTVAEVRERWYPTTGVFMRWHPEARFDYERWLENPTGREMHLLWDPPRRGAASLHPVPLYYDDQQAERLARAWRSALLSHPFAYLAGRLRLWRHQIGVGYTPLAVAVLDNPPSRLGYERAEVPLLSEAAATYARVWLGAGDVRAGTFVHRVWPYLLVCLLGLMLLLPRFPAPVRMVGTLAAAAVGLQVGLFFMAPSVELRFQLLTIYAALVTAAVAARLWAGRRAGHRQARSRGG